MSYFALVSSTHGCRFCQKNGITSIEELTEEEYKNEHPNFKPILESKFYEFKTKEERDAFKKNVSNFWNFKNGKSYGEQELQNFLKIYPELLIYIS